MDKGTYLLLSTIFFAVAIIAYVLYFLSRRSSFLATAIVTILIGCVFNHLAKKNKK